VLAGCESSQERSAQLEKVARLRAAHAPRSSAQRLALAVARPSSKIRITSTVLVHSDEGAAAVVSLLNTSSTVLREIPIAITIKSASGATLYTNEAPGLASTLVSLPALGARATGIWIDDQVPASDASGTVSARVGEGDATREAAPPLAVVGARPGESGSGGSEAEGSLVNHSPTNLGEVVVYAVARRAGAIVAAGLAVVPRVPARSSTHFSLTFIGDTAAAQAQYTPLPVRAG
jgi:hypothetical protein